MLPSRTASEEDGTLVVGSEVFVAGVVAVELRLDFEWIVVRGGP